MTPTGLRRSSERWSKLSVLLTSLERGIQMSARLDAYVPVNASIGRHHTGLESFNKLVVRLERRIDHELDVLTVERLTQDLAQKRARDFAAELARRLESQP